LEIKDQIKEMVNSGFSVFYVYTEDEVSVERQLTMMAEEREAGIGRWTVLGDNPLDDFLGAEFPNNFFVICINPHLNLDSPGVMQTIKDQADKWKATDIHVFLLCNDKKIPPEVNRNLTYIEWGLPDKDELGDKLEFVRESALDELPDLPVFDNGEKTALVKAALGLTSQQAEDAFALSLIQNQAFVPNVVTRIKANEYLKAGLMELEEPKPFESFKGYTELQEYMVQSKSAFYQESKYGLSPPKGILLTGVPGVGKTLASQAIASMFGLMLLKVDLGKLFGELVGQTESKTRQLIAIAERMAPIVLRFDEIEKQMGGMGVSSGDSGVSSRILASLLTWMQERTAPVYTIMTANDVSRLRPEMLRKGRIDEIFFLDLPDKQERSDIFEYHLELRVPEVNWSGYVNDLNEAHNKTKGWSGAEIEQVVIQTLRRAERSDIHISEDLQFFILDLINEIYKTVPLSVIRREDIDAIRKWAVDNNARLASKNEIIEKAQVETRRKLSISK